MEKKKETSIVPENWLCAGPLQHSASLFPIYKSALAFNSYFHWVHRSVSHGWKLSVFLAFSEHVYYFGHACGFLNSPAYTSAFECLNFPDTFSPTFPPGFQCSYFPQLQYFASGGCILFFRIILFSRNSHHFFNFRGFWVSWNKDKLLVSPF